MSLNLTKGQTLNLTKEAKTPLTAILLAAGWDMKGDKAVDLDLLTVAVKADGKVVSEAESICFFNQKSTPSMNHSGDNLTGAGDGDDEVIKIDLTKVPADVVSIKGIVHYYNASAGDDLSQIDNAFARVVNANDNAELARATVSSGSGRTLHFVEINRNGSDWEVKSVADFTSEDLTAVFAKYGA